MCGIQKIFNVYPPDTVCPSIRFSERLFHRKLSITINTVISLQLAGLDLKPLILCVRGSLKHGLTVYSTRTCVIMIINAGLPHIAP